MKIFYLTFALQLAHNNRNLNSNLRIWWKNERMNEWIMLLQYVKICVNLALYFTVLQLVYICFEHIALDFQNNQHLQVITVCRISGRSFNNDYFAEVDATPKPRICPLPYCWSVGPHRFILEDTDKRYGEVL